MVVEAIVESMEAKQKLFQTLEQVVSPQCVLATNTSSLSVTGVASACQHPERVVGLHFFIHAPLMGLVEVIPALQTDSALGPHAMDTLTSWEIPRARARHTRVHRESGCAALLQ